MNKEIWIIAEHFDGRVRPVTYELAAFARRIPGQIRIVVIGHPVRPLADEIARVTGIGVTGIDFPAAALYSAEVYRKLIKKLCERQQPRYLLIPHTPFGSDYAPALAVDLGFSSLAAVTLFQPENSTFIRQILNGKLLEELKSPPGCPAVITVMSGSALPETARSRPAGPVQILELEIPPLKTRTIRHLPAPPTNVNLKDAEVIVSAGRGLKDPERIGLIRELSLLFKRGAVGASRPLCDQGWLPLGHQVGMTGSTVAPKLYLACGISGALQHTVGMKNSGLIVAVNTDRKAPILQVAHFCVNADLSQFLPVLIEKIRKLKGRP